MPGRDRHWEARRICTRQRTSRGALVGCKILATWKVGLALQAYESSSVVEYMFEQAVVCNHCRTKLKLSDVLHSRMFSYVSAQMLLSGKQPPKKNLTRLAFEHLREGYSTIVSSR